MFLVMFLVSYSCARGVTFWARLVNLRKLRFDMAPSQAAHNQDLRWTIAKGVSGVPIEHFGRHSALTHGLHLTHQLPNVKNMFKRISDHRKPTSKKSGLSLKHGPLFLHNAYTRSLIEVWVMAHGAITGRRAWCPARGRPVMAPWAITEARYGSVGPSGSRRKGTSFAVSQ